MAAQWSAVMPSLCAALTSAPCFSSERTASRSPCMAASATAGAGAAATTSAATHHAPASPTPIAAANLLRSISSSSGGLRRFHAGVQIECRRAVAEGWGVDVQVVQHSQKRVRHWRAVGCLDVHVALDLSAGVASQEQRTALVVVDIRVAHRRSVHDEAVLEQVTVAVARILQLLEQIRHHADVIPVDLRVLEDPILALLVMRRRMEAGLDAALRIRAARRIASELEREDARDVRRQCER